MSDGPKCFNQTFPVARKEHRCCECGGRINVKERYHHFSGIWDAPETYKTCIDCHAIRERLLKELGRWSHLEEWYFGDLSENWRQSDVFDREFEPIMIKRGVVIEKNRRILPAINVGSKNE